MKVYLVQHGKPVPEREDPARPLSEEGRGDVRKAALFLVKAGIRVERILHSGKSRARQTAEIIGNALKPQVLIQEKSGLAPLDEVSSVAGFIEGQSGDVLIAGHLPHLARLATFLVTGAESTSVVRFRQGGVLCLERGEEGDWAVAWMVVPEIL